MKRFWITLFALLSLTTRGELVRNTYEGVRPTGMGNAFIALADDANALFYNPAGLSQIKGAHFNMFNFVHGTDSLDSSSRFYNAITKSEFDRLVRPDTQFMRFGFLPTFVVPNFGVALFSHGQGFFNIQDISTTGIEVYAFNDVGIQTGFSLPLGDYFSIGLSGKAIQRTGMDATLSPTDIVSMIGVDPNAFLNNIYNHLSTLSGTGYGFGASAGALLRIPTVDKRIRLTVAATADDIGDIKFRPIGDTRTPPNAVHSYNFGAALKYPIGKNSFWNTTLDMRNQLSSVPFTKQLHFGTEIRHKVFGIRGGVNQGYWTAGASIEFPPHTRLHFSTYGVELSDQLWRREDRWYLVQLTIGFNPL